MAHGYQCLLILFTSNNLILVKIQNIKWQSVDIYESIGKIKSYSVYYYILIFRNHKNCILWKLWYNNDCLTVKIDFYKSTNIELIWKYKILNG